jgi:formylglycine-generating enzyme required for sulfatase activity
VPDDDPPELVALARLQLLNTMLLANGLRDRGEADGLVVIRYETAVLHPDAVRASLARVVPRAPGFGAPPGEVTPVAEETYATTNHKRQLSACLDQSAAETIRTATLRALAAGRCAVPAPAWELARDWAEGDHLYSLMSGPRSDPRHSARRVSHGGDRFCPVRWIRGRSNDLLWRNLLVSNSEFAAFLNELGAVGLANCLDGSYLLACEMPHERGGRVHYDLREGKWIVSPGFGSHPAYWVTWIGAAAFAARYGARLPTRAEMVAETSRGGCTITNCSYQSGDTVPVTEPGRHLGEVHHLVGNLQVWCADGPPRRLPGPALRWLHGVAWNTPGAPKEISRQRARHLSGASRGVGIRLVRDDARRPAASVAQISDTLRRWTGLLADRGQSLHILDEALADALTVLSEPDSGLRAHIGTRSGETSHG